MHLMSLNVPEIIVFSIKASWFLPGFVLMSNTNLDLKILLTFCMKMDGLMKMEVLASWDQMTSAQASDSLLST